MKNTRILVMLFVISIPFVAFAQETKEDKDSVKFGWKHSLISTLNLSQVSYTNWAAGGDNALAYNLLIDGRSIQEEQYTNWTTNYKFSYGEARLSNLGLRKTDDKIDLESIIAYKMSEHWDPYGSATFKTQFTTGYVYNNDSLHTKTAVSDFLDPAISTQAVGMSFKHAESFRSRLGIGLRETFTKNYTVYSNGQKTLVQGGFESVTEVQLELDSNILFKGKLELFAPIETLTVITVRSDDLLEFKVNKYIVASFGLEVINDKIVTPRTQIKEGLALGLTYTVF